MNYIKSSSNDEMKSKLAPAAKNTSTATAINSYSTAFYQVIVSDQPTLFF